MHVIHKRSFESLKKDLSSTIEDIKSYSPEVIYIHLGTNDIAAKRELDPILNDFHDALETILKQTSQNCLVVYSHILPTGYPDRNITIEDLQHLIANHISSNLHKSQISSEHWNRVGQNFNNNFYHQNNTFNPSMVTNDGVHPNGRGIRVIMGNFRSRLHDIFSSHHNQAQRR